MGQNECAGIYPAIIAVIITPTAGILISVEALIDMGRTALNVNGSMVAGTLTSKALDNFDDEIFNDETAVETSSAM